MVTINVIGSAVISFLYTIYTSSAISDTSINFAADYFVGVNIRYICLVTCGRGSWHQKFTQHVSTRSIKVSHRNIIKPREYNGTNYIDRCLMDFYIPIGILIDPTCNEFKNVLLYASKKYLLDSNHKWLIIEERVNNRENRENNSTVSVDGNEFGIPCATFLSTLNLSVNADVTVAVTEDFLTYNLYEVYNYGKVRGGKFIIEIIGNWNMETGLNITKDFKYYRRWHFKEMTLKMAVAMSPVPKVFDPQMILSRSPHPGTVTAQVTGAQIFYEIASTHNIRFELLVFDRWVGNYSKNDKDSINTALYYHKADITPILRYASINFDRLLLIHPPVSYIDSKYYYKISAHGVGKFENQFLQPLSGAAWWGVTLISVLCGLVLFLSAVVEKRQKSVDFAICSVLALICQQFFEEAEDIRRISTARKMTIFVTGISCLLIYNYYTSSVVSWLLNGPPPTINNLWELMDSSLKPIFQEVGYSNSWLQLPGFYFNKKWAEAEDVYKKRIINVQKRGLKIFTSVDEGIKKIQGGGYVFHADSQAASKIISQTFTQVELCDLGSLQSMEKTLVYSSVPTNSGYREFFTWSLARFQERGVMDCIRIRTRTPEVKCEGSTPRALALGGAAPAFIILGGGFIVAIFIMLIERCKWKHDKLGKKHLKMITKP